MRHNFNYYGILLGIIVVSSAWSMHALSAMDKEMNNERIIAAGTTENTEAGEYLPGPDANGIVYVNASAASGGDGSSWAGALTKLNEAIKVAAHNTAIKEIHVAKGTYYPGGKQNSSKRDVSFVILRGGLKLLGGYDAQSGKRDINNNTTILSGDIGKLNDPRDNAYHVLVLSNIAAEEDSIVIEGFTIKDGYANGSKDEGVVYNNLNVAHAHGGGLYVVQALNKIALRYCNISGNAARNWGGGIYNSRGSAPYLWHCTITGNSASEAGGGVLNDRKSAPKFVDCVISDNTAKSNSGGAMFNNASYPVIINSVIAGNKSAGHNGGGGIRNFRSAPTMINSIVVNNTTKGKNGGGMLNNGSSVPRIFNCIFWDNKAGGAINNIYSAGDGDQPELSCTYLQGESSSWSWNKEYSGIDKGGNVVSTETPFVNEENNDYRLKAGSRAVDAGNAKSIPAGITADMDGHPRIVNKKVDMGAYETQK